MIFSKLLTWLDVKRVIREETSYGSNLPDGIVRIICYSDALEVGVSQPEDIGNAKQALREWFSEWYQEEQSAIQLDFGNSVLPVEFIPGEERADIDISVRPFWEEIAYVRSDFEGEAETPINVKLPEPFPADGPRLVSFYSFKGGVGRTLHLSAFLFALLDRAKELGLATTVLVIDADLEAPGLTYWNRREKQQPAVSFLEFLEVYHYSPLEMDEMLALFAKEVKKAPKTEGKSTWYLLPACLNDKQLLDTPVLPEHLARSPEGTWECGDAIYRLGRAIGADYVLLDLRAGLSEISSPIIFDPRIQRYIVTTIAEQSVSGSSLVIQQISRLAPSEPESTDGKVDYYDPSLIVSMLKQEFRQLPDFDNSLERLRSSYIESGEDIVYAKRLQILETDFAEELLYINGWEDARQKLGPTSIMKIAREWANNQLSQEDTVTPSEMSYNDTLNKVRKLRDVCKEYVFAEGGQAKRLLITEPLKHLANKFHDELPRVVSIGAKGAGKTFNYIQLSQFGLWENFLNRVLKEEPKSESETYIFPLLQSNGLKEEARRITQQARTRVRNALKDDSPEFSPLGCQDRVKAKLHDKDATELEWTIFWVDEIAKAVGMTLGERHSNRLANLNLKLKDRGLRIIFLLDGLEDIFGDISSNVAQQRALKALVDLPLRLSEIRQANIGLVVFVRRDFIRYAVTQNIAQFENLYRAYDLSWDEDSFRKLVFWICSQAGVIGAGGVDIEDVGRDNLSERLERLWGMKLGSDNSKEAYTVNWVFAALTDFKGRLQARDIVRFLLHAADITFNNPKNVMFEKWASSRLLPPQAVRGALVPCSQEKVKEAIEEYPEFRKWIDKITTTYEPSDRKIPFTLEQFDMDQATVRILEDMGVIYEDRGKDDASRFYMPEIFRTGLNFSLDKRARPRVLVLKRKALGPASS
ncbi:MAG: ParA family protein [Deltaproteobacteria bacterium]|nr:ParA family protein [Deltaproteobacteria bacterium]